MAGFRALATVKDQLKRGKGLDRDREKTYDWSRQERRFTTKKNKAKSQFQASPRNRKVAFLRGPVKGEILVAEWPNRSRQVRWARTETQRKEKKKVPCDSLIRN